MLTRSHQGVREHETGNESVCDLELSLGGRRRAFLTAF